MSTCQSMLNTEQRPNPRHFPHLRAVPELMVGEARQVNHQSSFIICSPDVCAFLPFHLHQHVEERQSRRAGHMCFGAAHMSLPNTQQLRNYLELPRNAADDTPRPRVRGWGPRRMQLSELRPWPTGPACLLQPWTRLL